MSHEREPGHFVLVKPCGGLWVMLPEDRTLIDIDMDPEEMRALARELAEQADRVDTMPRGLPHPSAVARWGR